MRGVGALTASGAAGPASLPRGRGVPQAEGEHQRPLVGSYEHALQTMRDVPWDKWRVFDPEDTIRFYALRLHEAGMIKASPKKLIAEGTDWRFLKELKREMKV